MRTQQPTTIGVKPFMAKSRQEKFVLSYVSSEVLCAKALKAILSAQAHALSSNFWLRLGAYDNGSTCHYKGKEKVLNIKDALNAW